jgi:GT2 family glycosyltransferase
MAEPMISVLICSIDPSKYERVTANYSRVLADHPHEIIGIHDARSLAEGYNRAVRKSRGDFLLFSHDDVEIVSGDLAPAIVRASKALDVIGVVGTSKVLSGYWPAAGHPFLHGWLAQPAPAVRPAEQRYYVGVFGVEGPLTAGVQGLDGMFFVARRAVVESVPFDEQTFDGFHGYDLDFSFTAHLAGFSVGTSAEIAVIHASGGSFGDAWQRYANRFAEKHRERLPAEVFPAKWSFARMPVESKEAIVRDFPLERLMAITRQLRAAASPAPPSAI